MPILRRIHMHGNFSVTGGGGGSPITPTVPWGPDFGGADGDRYAIALNHRMPAIGLLGSKTIANQHRLTALRGVWNQAIGVHQDFNAAVNYNAQVEGIAHSMPQVAANYNASQMALAHTMPAVGAAANHPIGIHQSGSVLGAPFFQNATTVATTASAISAVIPAPSGIQDGDLLLFLIANRGLASTVNITGTPAGATPILSEVQGFARAASYYKVASSESGDYTFTASADADWCCTCLLIRAIDSTTPINQSADQGASATDPVCPTVTTSAVNCMLVRWCAQQETLANTYTPPAGYQEVSDLNATNLALASLASTVAIRVQAAAGATGTATLNSSQILGSNYRSQTIAIAPGTLIIAP